MTIALINAVIGLLICSCVLLAPHTCRRNGIAGSIAFSLLAGASIAAYASFEVMR